MHRHTPLAPRRIRPADGPTTEDVDAALNMPAWHLGFPPVLEARFESDQRQSRERQLLLAGAIALLVYDLFLINDVMLRPEALPAALAARLGLLTSYALLVLVLVRRGLPPRWREAAMASTLVVAMLASCEIFRHTRSAAGLYDPFAFSLVFMAGNIAFALRFMAATVTSVLSLAIAISYLMLHPMLPPEARQFALSVLLGTAVFTVLACYRMEHGSRQSYLLRLREELRSQAAQELADTYQVIAQTDALTGLPNRRAFDLTLQRRWQQALQQRGALALLMLDVDHFKRYNDLYGHPAGDQCLRAVAGALSGCLRAEDMIARVGGEEFAVLLQGDDTDAGPALAERLCRAVEALGMLHEGAEGRLRVTISVGLARIQPDPSRTPDLLMAAADAALYQAKHDGRNRWHAAQEVHLPSGLPGRLQHAPGRATA